MAHRGPITGDWTYAQARGRILRDIREARRITEGMDLQDKEWLDSIAGHEEADKKSALIQEIAQTESWWPNVVPKNWKKRIEGA